MDETTCPNCGYDKTYPCCSFAKERDELYYQIKMERVLRESYTKIIRRLEEKLSRIEQSKKEIEQNAEIPKETSSN